MIELPKIPKIEKSPKIELLMEIHKEIQTDLDDKEKLAIENIIQKNFGDRWHEVDITTLSLLRDGILKLKKKKATENDIREHMLRTLSFDNLDYEERYVLFLDILGFKNIIKFYRAIDVRNVFDLLRHTLYCLNKGAGIMGVNVPDDVVEDIKYVIMSDSIVMSFPKSGDGFLCFVLCCVNLQIGSLNFQEMDNNNSIFEFPLLFRGGLACGEILHHEQVVYGPALISAYELECKKAVFPRVIMTNETYDNGLLSVDKENQVIIKTFIKKDDDGNYYIDYLNNLDAFSGTGKRRMDKWISANINDDNLSGKAEWINKKRMASEKLYQLFRESITDTEYKDLLKKDFHEFLTKYLDFINGH